MSPSRGRDDVAAHYAALPQQGSRRDALGEPAEMPSADRFEHVARIADTVLYEGYLLYPYRKSALKNRHRWQMGAISPPPARAGGSGLEPSHAGCDCLVDAGEGSYLDVQVRFLQMQRRIVEEPASAGIGPWQTCERVTVDGRDLQSWEEALPRVVTQPSVPLAAGPAEHRFVYEVAGGREEEVVHDASGRPAARVVREREALRFSLLVAAQPEGGLQRVRVRVENTGTPIAGRSDALARSLLACHALLGVVEGGFVSTIDPPAEAADAAASCARDRWWPVLAGPQGTRDMVLCAPMILYDHPQVAPESAGDMFDATEIDELLTLRLVTLTGDEKREMAAADERARAMLERAERDTAGLTARLHGATRKLEHSAPEAAEEPSWEHLLNPPDADPPERDSVLVAGALVTRGSRIRLEPRGRADAMDMFLRGRLATVEAVYRDLEDRVHLAVTLDDDPGADLRRELGRALYFAPEDVVPLADGKDVSDGV